MHISVKWSQNTQELCWRSGSALAKDLLALKTTTRLPAHGLAPSKRHNTNEFYVRRRKISHIHPQRKAALRQPMTYNIGRQWNHGTKTECCRNAVTPLADFIFANTAFKQRDLSHVKARFTRRTISLVRSADEYDITQRPQTPADIRASHHAERY